MNKQSVTTLACALALMGAVACKSKGSEAPEESAAKEPVAAAPSPAPEAPKTAVPTEAAPAPADAGPSGPGGAIPVARVGDVAPLFTLEDLDGNSVDLGSFKGKTVVLEWFNPGCPFVKNAHTKGSLVDTAKRHMKEGVVWLAINSGAPGKQGHGVGTNRDAKTKLGMTYPILLDEKGTVGRMYGAERTPHMFIIDGAGKLVYKGAIDNSPDGEGESPEGGKLVNYVDQALSELTAGKPVSVAETKSYGCSVKYGAS